MRRFVLHSKKTAFIVEHDFIMATYLADRVIVYDGQPSVAAVAHAYVVCFAHCIARLKRDSDTGLPLPIPASARFLPLPASTHTARKVC